MNNIHPFAFYFSFSRLKLSVKVREEVLIEVELGNDSGLR